MEGGRWRGISTYIRRNDLSAEGKGWEAASSGFFDEGADDQ